MGFLDFLKKVFTTEYDDAELRAARERHGIKVDERDEKEADEDIEVIDPWEVVSNARINFFVGKWASHKFRIFGEEKVKKQLEELDRKREEKERKKKEEKGEGG